jgi:hypothetical protein
MVRVGATGEPAIIWYGNFASFPASTVFSLEESDMARKPQVAVEPRPGGRWAVQTDGTQRAYRVYDGKAAAIATGRSVAKNQGVELVIKNESGRIAGKDSHGKDPRRIKG